MLHFEDIAKFGVSKRINSTPAGVDQLIFGSIWLCYFCIFQVSQCPSVTMLFNLLFTDSGPIKSWHFLQYKKSHVKSNHYKKCGTSTKTVNK